MISSSLVSVHRLQIAALITLSLVLTVAIAGPPYVTDDPAPTDFKHWEIYQFVDAVHVQGSTSGAAGLDLNYGAAENLQLTLVLPAEFIREDQMRWVSGAVEVAAKYRIVDASTDNHVPDVALFPRVFIPTHHDTESEHLSLLLPVWMGKEMDEWSWFGGGGYLLNPGVHNRNAWQSGVAVTRALGVHIHLGIEIYHQTAATDHDQAFTGLNVGADYRLNKHWSLLGSFGPSIEHAKQEGQDGFYFALKADY